MIMDVLKTFHIKNDPGSFYRSYTSTYSRYMCERVVDQAICMESEREKKKKNTIEEVYPLEFQKNAFAKKFSNIQKGKI